MAIKMSTKPHVEKTEIEKIARMAINALDTKLRKDDFRVLTDGDDIVIETVDIKAFMSRRQIIIQFSFIDIKYSNSKTTISVYDYEKDDVDYIDMDTLNYDMDRLFELAKKKVKEKLEKAIREIE
jgi:hypothetical protein